MWFLGLVLLASVAGSVPLVRTVRQMEIEPDNIGPPREPSCAELRAMWRHMRRMARHSQLTNEIPRFGHVLLQEPAGRFLDYPLPESSLGGVFGTVVRSPDERGVFGRFDPPRRQSCRLQQGRRCTRDSQCVCFEAKLRCVEARCRSSPAIKKVLSGDEWGYWHSGPVVDSSLLGASVRRLRD